MDTPAAAASMEGSNEPLSTSHLPLNFKVKEVNVHNIAGEYHDHSNTVVKNITAITNAKNSIEPLLEHVAAGALHDSAERGPHAPKCHPDTRIAVQKEIMSWIRHGNQDDDPKQILWLSGPAGSGKTAIAGTIADECYKAGLLAASFFFSAFSGSRKRRSMGALIPTLVYRLLEHKVIQGFKEEVLLVLEEDPMVFYRHIDQQLEYLILKPLRKIAGSSNVQRWPVVILIDGLDECEGCPPHSPDHQSPPTAHKEILSTFARACADPAFPFRIIIASRPEPEIRHFFTSSPTLALELFLDDKYEPDADIKLYLESMFSDIRRRSNLPSSWAPNDVVDLLVREASGQFVYASTVMRFLNDARHPPQKQLSRILEWRRLDNSEPFAPLDALYSRILHTSPEPTLATKWILLIDNHLNHTPFYVKTLLESYIGEVEHVLGSLLSLVGLVDAKSRPHFHFYHKSLLDFLRDHKRSQDLYVTEEGQKQFAMQRYYAVLRGRGTDSLRGSDRNIANATSHTEVHDFFGTFCQWLDVHIDPHNLYTPDDVQWWLDHIPRHVSHRSIPSIFASIHKQCQWHYCLPACKIWRKEILKHCKANAWRLPTALEMFRDKFEKFTPIYASSPANSDFPLRPAVKPTSTIVLVPAMSISGSS